MISLKTVPSHRFVCVNVGYVEKEGSLSEIPSHKFHTEISRWSAQTPAGAYRITSNCWSSTGKFCTYICFLSRRALPQASREISHAQQIVGFARTSLRTVYRWKVWCWCASGCARKCFRQTILCPLRNVRNVLGVFCDVWTVTFSCCT